MRYKSAAALEMAVKSAASASPMDTGRAVSAFYFHRLLCRVFAGGNGSFVLKGGRAMLARTVDARATSTCSPRKGAWRMRSRSSSGSPGPTWATS